MAAEVPVLLVWLACVPTVTDTETLPPPTSSTPTTDTDPSSPPTTPATVADLAWSLNDTVGSVVHAAWTQSAPATVHVEYQVDPGVWRASPSFSASAGPQTQTLVGIPYGATVDWRVVVEGGATTDGAPITTADRPSALPVPVVEIPWDADAAGGPFVLTCLKQEGTGWNAGTFWVVVLDTGGRYVWALRTPDRCLFPQVSVTGDYLLWDQATFWSDFDLGAGSRVHYRWLDEEFDVVDTPGVHHAFVQLPDGTLAWASRMHGGDEAVVEKAPGQEDETVVWSCADDWPEGAGYNCHNNGMYYRADTDTYLLSFPLWSSVVVTSRSHETLWYAGSWIGGGFDFDPSGSAFTWEHGVSFTPAGNLLLSGNLSYTTWCLEYEVDEPAETLRYVWGSDSGVLLSNSGQCWRMADGHTLHVVGDAGVIRETDAAGVDLWRLAYPNANLLGQGERITDLYALVKPR